MTASEPQRRPLIMGIVNVTPDSFSGDGVLSSGDYVAAGTERAGDMLDHGADILDIGGESSRPGSVPVPLDEELRRVIPVITAIKQKYPMAVIAIDTVKASVADKALAAGATIVNDISALRFDKHMASVVADAHCRIVLMDNRSKTSVVHYHDVVGGAFEGDSNVSICDSVIEALKERVAYADANGISRDKIILDPGLGFGKTIEQNFSLIRAIPDLKTLGFPVLVGPSRKSFIGHVFDASVDERLEGTASVVAVASFLGADILRVHDVKVMSRVATLAAMVVASS